MDVGSIELKILQVTQPYVDQGYLQVHLLVGRVSILKAYRVNDIYFFLTFIL